MVPLADAFAVDWNPYEKGKARRGWGEMAMSVYKFEGEKEITYLASS